VQAVKKGEVGTKEQRPLAPRGHAPLRSLAEGNVFAKAQVYRRLVIGARKKKFVIDLFYSLKESWLYKAYFFGLRYE